MGEKEFYKEQLVQMIGEIEDKGVIEYLYVFVKEKIKTE